MACIIHSLSSIWVVYVYFSLGNHSCILYIMYIRSSCLNFDYTRLWYKECVLLKFMVNCWQRVRGRYGCITHSALGRVPPSRAVVTPHWGRGYPPPLPLTRALCEFLVIVDTEENIVLIMFENRLEAFSLHCNFWENRRKLPEKYIRRIWIMTS